LHCFRRVFDPPEAEGILVPPDIETKEPDTPEIEKRFEARRNHPLETMFLLDLLRDPDSRIPLFWATGTLLWGSCAYHWLEGWSYLDALYLCVVSLATVGYGDLAPKTPLGRAFAILYIINGEAILLALFDRIRVVRGRQIASRDHHETKGK
jgi:voltage-gated potassium channel